MWFNGQNVFESRGTTLVLHETYYVRLSTFNIENISHIPLA